MKNLYCDIDSTVNNHWARIQKWALPVFPGSSIHPNAFSRGEIMKDEPLVGARSVLGALSSGYKIHFLSARNFPDAHQITEEWLNKNNFKYDSINIVKSARDKVPFLAGVDNDLLIDDLSKGQEYGGSYVDHYHDVISLLKDAGVNLVLFKGSWYRAFEPKGICSLLGGQVPEEYWNEA